ncbi:ABC transporter substrate-binding protein [Candidatus Hodarchaeum mangrovi]
MKKKNLVFALVFVAFFLPLYISAVQAKPAAVEPLIKVHAIAPTNNPQRAMYAQLMEQELPKIGFEIELDLISWPAILQRAATTEVGVYAEGGYDIAHFGMSLGTPAGHPGESMNIVYHSDAVPPNGFNCMYWSVRPGHNNLRAAESDQLIEDINSELNQTESRELLLEWQEIFFDVMPNIMVYNLMEVHAVSKGISGYDPVAPALYSIEDIRMDAATYTGTAGTVVLGSSAQPTNFLNMIINDVYSQYTVGPAMDALVGLTPSIDVILPSGTTYDDYMLANYGTTSPLQNYPRIASDLGSYSEDGLNFTVSLRDDAYWHDGHKVDAWDVAFTYQAILTPDVGADEYSGLSFALGDDDKANHHGNYSFQVKDLDSDGHDETISIIFDVTYAPYLTDYFGYSLHPEHILGDPTNHGFDPGTGDFDPNNQWLVAPADWSSHSYNTADPNDPGGLKGPIGCGSMVFYDYDTTNNWVTLKKFENIKWDHGTGAWLEGEVASGGLSHYLVEAGELDDMADVAKVVPATFDAALAEMKAGDVNILDHQYSMGNVFDELQAEPTIVTAQTPATGWQCIYPNPKHPDLAKKGVRHAISHVVPRDDIVNYLFDGLAFRGYTPVPITGWGAMAPDDWVTMKKTIAATNGSLLLANEVTYYDSYDVELALDWLETEGYDVGPWREGGAGLTEPSGAIPGFEISVAIFAIIGSAFIIKKRRR